MNYWNDIKKNTTATDSKSGVIISILTTVKAGMKNTENILAEYTNIHDELDHLEEDNIELGCKELGALNVKWCEENGYDPAKILDLHNNLISEYDYVILKAREQDE